MIASTQAAYSPMEDVSIIENKPSWVVAVLSVTKIKAFQTPAITQNAGVIA